LDAVPDTLDRVTAGAATEAVNSSAALHKRDCRPETVRFESGYFNIPFSPRDSPPFLSSVIVLTGLYSCI